MVRWTIFTLMCAGLITACSGNTSSGETPPALTTITPPVMTPDQSPTAIPASTMPTSPPAATSSSTADAVQSRPPTISAEALPSAAAPPWMTAIQLPDSAESVAQIFEQMPSDVAGIPRLTRDAPGPGMYAAEYSDDPAIPPAVIYAQHISEGVPAHVGWTAADVIANDLLAGQPGIVGGRDGALVWLQQTGAAVMVAWGRAESDWLFVAMAPSMDQLDAIVAAFAASAATMPPP